MNFEWLNDVNTYNPYTFVGTRAAIDSYYASTTHVTTLDAYETHIDRNSISPYLFERKILGVPIRLLGLDNEEECIEETHINEESLEDFLSSFGLIKEGAC